MKAAPLIFITFFMISCTPKAPEAPLLDCNFDEREFTQRIQSIFSADSVRVYSTSIQEEIYFEPLIAIRVVIFNPVTKILNFKKLKTDPTQRFDDYEEVENGLKNEGFEIAEEVANQCCLREFNDIIVEFWKPNGDDYPFYRFICHYKELIREPPSKKLDGTVLTKVIYAASNRSLAMAEVAVHFSLSTLPGDYHMLTIHVPDDSSMKVIQAKDLLPSWNQFPHLKDTQHYGDDFINSNTHCLLKVPSAVTKGDFNILINPFRPDFSAIKIINHEKFPFDERLFQS